MNSDIFSQTKTKYIESYFKGTPELNNIYGSLNNLLKKILTEPYNSQEVIEVSSLENNLILTLSIGHGFLQNQVIILEGASNSELNIEYRVVEVSSVSITIRSPLPDPIETLTQESITISGAPLGYSVCYENLDEGILCIKNTNKESPAILRVIDKIPPNEYGTNWSKYGRVTIGQHITEEGTFVDNIKAPFHPGFPYAEETGNDVKGEGGIHGFAKWRYSLGSNYEPTENRVPSGTFPTRWRVVGDSNTFYLMIHTTGLLSDQNYSYDLVGFGNFLSYNLEERTNVCLQATDGFYSANNNPTYAPSRPKSYFGALNYVCSGFLFTDVYGSHKTGYNYHTNIGNYLSNDNQTHPWYSPNISSVNPETGAWVTSKLIIKDNLNFIRGEHRGVRIIYGTSRLPDGMSTEDGTISLVVQSPHYMSSFYTTTMLFSLKDWEE